MARLSRQGRKEKRFQRDLSLDVDVRRFEVGEPDAGTRLDRFLAERLRWRSRTRVRELVVEGRVEVEPSKDLSGIGQPKTRPALRLRRGQEVVVCLDSAHVEAAGCDDSQEDDAPEELRIVWDDDRLVAVSKPPGVNLYPTRRHRQASLLERVHRWHSASAGQSPPPSPCHRLDRETSGLVLFARDREARAFVGEQFEARTVIKTYLAITSRPPSPAEGRIVGPLGPDSTSRVELKQALREDGKPARTDYRTLEPVGAGALVEVRPRTGRAHQIRAHLASIGCPILGDKLYFGGDEVFLRHLAGELESEDWAQLGLERQALHAHRLRLRHPGTSQSFEIEAPLWPDMASLCRRS